MTRAIVARRRRAEENQEPLPPALSAELRARISEAARRRDGVFDEARQQRRQIEAAAAEVYERARRAAQDEFERERDAIRHEIERRALVEQKPRDGAVEA